MSGIKKIMPAAAGEKLFFPNAGRAVQSRVM
jgi:hypothetical protein